MKKSLIFKILYLFLGLVVMAGASVFATNTYLASQVSYGNTNVENALNDLYTLKGNDENYSTEEKVVGKWIDGKPIYRRVYTLTNINLIKNTYTTVVFDDNLKYVNEVIDGHLRIGFSPIASVPSSASLGFDVAVYKNSSVSGSGLQIYNNRTSDFKVEDGRTMQVIIEYTKTTDNTN